MRRIFAWLARLAFAGVVLALGGGVAVVFAFHYFSRDLPPFDELARYEPPTVTRIHAGDGELLAEFATEKRVFVPVAAMPSHVKEAFVAAEDQNFYHHFGVDPIGIARAVVDNVQRLRDNERPQGASTITQQVAKNFLLSNELSFERKAKEAIIAMRIEEAFSKDQILELYLNEIFLGRRSYGVAAASLNYFDKALDELSIAEAAFLAGLPKAPSRYDPERDMAAAIERRNYVIRRMAEDGYITAEQAEAARAEPIDLRRRARTEAFNAGFFTEEVRRSLTDAFTDSGFYEGGLVVQTTVDPKLQTVAERALRSGLEAYDRRHVGYRGPVARIEDPTLRGDPVRALATIDPGFELVDLRLALVTSVSAEAATIAFADGTNGILPVAGLSWAGHGAPVTRADAVLAAGDAVLVELVEPEGATSYFALRQRPEVEGALVALDPHTGRVLALTGGFSFRQSKFNRATQARRQPGSAFKPFVYLAAMENGYTPADILLDAPIVIDQGPGLPKWKPENYSEQFYGPSTLRLGLEKSRNLMTVRLADALGMPKVADVAHRFGIDDELAPGLAGALGSSEVTLIELTTAYAMLVNGGKRITPALVERIQDRQGRTVFRRDDRPCPGCRDVAWNEQLPPIPPDDRQQVTDPRHAFQVVAMLEGVVERGTGARANRLGRPLAGKTGTTNESRDAWFVGFSPDLAVGVYVGFDKPASLGRRETGASVALPIWIDFMTVALEDQPALPFRTPAGISMVRIDADTGLLPGPATQRVISEAFVAGTAPSERAPTGVGGTARVVERSRSPGATASPGAGGLY